MRTLRLVVSPDSQVTIPDAEPGQVVTVVLEEPRRSSAARQFKPVSDMTFEEKEAFRNELRELGRRAREELKGEPPIDHGAYLYGEGGLPT